MDGTAIVTGGGSGIGRAVSLALAKSGFSVALVGRKRDRLYAVAAEIEAAGGKALPLQGDITDPDAMDMVFDTVVREFGRLDLLFNNAGTSAPKVTLEDLALRHWMRVLNANVTGTFLCTQRAFRIMKAQTPRGGRIVNNGSVSAHSPRPFGVAYTASKHAVTGLTKSTALDGRQYDIACGQIDIGNSDTEGNAKLAAGMTQPDGRVIPEPTMDVQAVAEAVVFMAGLPLDANVQFMTILATKMPFVGRG
jgi:NAD(P)-dependent dehydrogenase (short-subunit alcohol dehydrogenase family)